MASSDRARRRELPRDTDFLEFLLSLPPEAWEDALRRFGFTEADGFDRDWRSWAHDGQEAPDGDWSTCVIMGGRSFGKTRAGAEWIASLVGGGEGDSLSDCPHSAAAARGQSNRLSRPLQIALVGATLAEARRVMVEGRSGLLEVAGPWIREWRPSLGTLRFRTGAVATLFSGHSPELLRGPEHDYAWCDELAKWEKPGETWDMLQFGLRSGDRPRVLVTTTPRPGPVLRAIMASPGCVTIGGPSSANPHNAPAWLKDMDARYAGTRLGRQELDGELLPDTPGALWTVELLEKCRVDRDPGAILDCREQSNPALRSGDSPHFPAEGRSGDSPHFPSEPPSPHRPARENGDCPHSPPFTRILIGVDPPVGDGTCGIVACAKDEAGTAHVLADHSVTARSPEGWARAVADAASVWGHLYASVRVQIVAEQNQGGKMVRAVLHTADPDLRVKLVTAHVGKAERAAPIAMLFEAGKVALHGRFPELEAELLGMIQGGDYEPVWSGGPGGPGTSPDRADAMVWALTELTEGRERVPRVRAL